MRERLSRMLSRHGWFLRSRAILSWWGRRRTVRGGSLRRHRSGRGEVSLWLWPRDWSWWPNLGRYDLRQSWLQHLPYWWRQDGIYLLGYILSWLSRSFALLLGNEKLVMLQVILRIGLQ